MFAAFCDRKERPVKYHKKEYAPELFKELNDDRYGIFFSVNGVGKTRKNDDITKLNAVFGDFDVAKDGDGKTLEEITESKKYLFLQLLKEPQQPNIITATKNGLQPFWLLEDGEDDMEIYSKIENGLIEWSKFQGCAGDAVKDFARVLRLPGYNHMKSEPFKIKSYLIHEKKHKLEDLHKQYPFIEPTHDQRKEFSNNNNVLDKVDIRDVVREVYKEYKNINILFDYQNRICFDDEKTGLTGAFIGDNGESQFVGSTSSHVPDGNKVTFTAKVFDISNKEAFSWLLDRFNLKYVPNRSDPINYDEEDPLNWTPREEVPMRVREIDNITKFPTGFYVICAKSGVGKGFFSLWISRKIWENHKYKSVIFSVEMSESIQRERMIQAWSDIPMDEFNEIVGDREKLEERAANSVYMMKQGVVVIDEFPATGTPKQLGELIDDYVEKGIRIFHLDHIHEMVGTHGNDAINMVVEWASFFEDMAKKHKNCWFFVFAQPNQAASKKLLVNRYDTLGSSMLGAKAEFFISLNKAYEDDEAKFNRKVEDRNVFFWLDKTRYRGKSNVGTMLYFGKDGNFYTSELEANNTYDTNTQQIKKYMF